MDSTTSSIWHAPIIMKHRKTIHDLPADVLLIVFRSVFMAVCPTEITPPPRLSEALPQLNPWSDPYRLDVEYPVPECLAAVHPYWRQVMSGLSEFWKNFVIWTGRNATPISRVRQYLTWSGTHVLDVYVFRRYDPSVHDPSERAHMQAIFELLMPHIQRIQILCVNCLYASSLPRPRIDLFGHATTLLNLDLSSMIDDLVVGVDNRPHLRDLSMPALRWLSIHGDHFRESYVHGSSPLPIPPLLKTITICDYGVQNITFPVIDLVSRLDTHSSIMAVTLNNLRLDCSYDGPSLWKSDFNPDTVDFINMSGDVISEYARLLGDWLYSAVTYIACTVPTALRAGNGTPRSMHSTFEAFVDETALLYYLSNARGSLDSPCEKLSFVRCPALTPAVLRMLAGPTRPHGAQYEKWLCPSMTKLLLLCCWGICSADVRVVRL